jgi:choline kinase
MRAIILSAGQGSRLLPLTQDRPKCLLPVGPRSVIEWQVRHLAAGGVTEIAVVLGFHAESVAAELQKLAGPNLAIRTIFNPFYKVADNLGSCWMARHEMDRDFLLLNGDTLFEPSVLRKLVAEASDPITVTIDRKADYDADDMKVRTEGRRLCEIGKALPIERVNGESIGFLAFRGNGPSLFRDAVDRTMHTPDGIKWWYLKVIDTLAHEGHVGTVSIEGLAWGEIDFPPDLERAERMVASWR